MQLIINRRYDQKGFHFYFRPFFSCIAFNWFQVGTGKTGWLFSVGFGRGAGYRWGSTFYFGFRARGGAGPLYGPWPSFRVSLTRNANRVPYSFGG